MTGHISRYFFQPVFLTVSQRQKRDLASSNALRNAREGTLTTEDDTLFHSRSLNSTNQARRMLEADLASSFKGAVRLFWTKEAVATHNQRSLTHLAAETGERVIHMTAVDVGKVVTPLPDDPDKTAGLLNSVDLVVGSPKC